MTQNELNLIQKKIGYSFRNPNLLIQAFTRTSYSHEHPEWKDYQTLEFFGDSVLGYYVTRKLCKSFFNLGTQNGQIYSRKSVGDFSKLRAQYVCKENLSRCIDALGFIDFLIFGNGESLDVLSDNDSAKEDLCEAIIGAVALDCDWNQNILENLCVNLLEVASFEDDYINLLEVWCKGHGSRFTFGMYFYQKISLTVYFDFGSKIFEGHGQTELTAKLDAAKQAIEICDIEDMQEYLPANQIIENESIRQLNELYQHFDYVFEQPEFLFSEQTDDNGNPYWFSKVIVTKNDEEIEEIGGGIGKKLAQRRAAFKMLATLLQYNLPSNYDDGCY